MGSGQSVQTSDSMRKLDLTLGAEGCLQRTLGGRLAQSCLFVYRSIIHWRMDCQGVRGRVGARQLLRHPGGCGQGCCGVEEFWAGGSYEVEPKG